MWERRIRFSAIRYSHCKSRRWFTRPVIYANNRTHLLSRIGNQHGTGVAPTLATSILTKRVWIPLKDGTVQRTTYSPGLNPYQNQYMRGVFTWNMDAGLIKNFPISERVNLRLNVDAFNVLNHPGTPNSISGT